MARVELLRAFREQDAQIIARLLDAGDYLCRPDFQELGRPSMSGQATYGNSKVDAGSRRTWDKEGE